MHIYPNLCWLLTEHFRAERIKYCLKLTESVLDGFADQQTS